MKINEIFTPNSFPTWTFVDDHLKEKEQQMIDALEDNSMLISISGPSKSGKTVFVEHSFGKDNLIQITGAGVKHASDIWMKVFHIIGTPIRKMQQLANSSASQVGATGNIEGNAFFAKANVGVSLNNTDTTHESTSTENAIDILQLLICEVANTGYIIFIDDFHYIPHDVQQEISKQIKEAIRQGVKIICASVPYHSDDVIKGNPDLHGRVFFIDFDYWQSDSLHKIVERGFSKGNINCPQSLINRLVAESAGSPQLMQFLCLNICNESNIREVKRKTQDIHSSVDILRRVCERTAQSCDFSSVVDKMIEGPKTRGSDRKLYISNEGWQGDVYKFLMYSLRQDPPTLNFRYQELNDRIANLCTNEHPSGSSVTGACIHAVNIACDSYTETLMEWDSENDVLDIRDPYFLFYLRWSNILNKQ